MLQLHNIKLKMYLVLVCSVVTEQIEYKSICSISKKITLSNMT